LTHLYNCRGTINVREYWSVALDSSCRDCASSAYNAPLVCSWKADADAAAEMLLLVVIRVNKMTSRNVLV